MNDKVDLMTDRVLRILEEKYGDERPVVIANMLYRMMEQRVKSGDLTQAQRVKLTEHLAALLDRLQASEGTGGSLTTRHVIARYRLRKQLM